MTESTQLQTTENNNAGVVKMEPPPPASSSSTSTSASATAAATNTSSASPAPSTFVAMEQLQVHQHSQNQQQQQQYALKWNDFQSSILNSFRHLRDEEDFVDVTLACDQRSFTAHKVVLSACSPYFRKLLKANPCEHPIVILRDVRSDDVENLLSFMYNGEVNVSHEHLPEFLKTAHLLQIRGLADVTGTSYVSGLNTSAAKSFSASLISNNNNNNNNSNNNNNNNKFNFQTVSQVNSSNLASPFTTPAALGSSVASAPASSLPSNNANNSNNPNSLNSSTSSSTPAIQELKASSASPAHHHWDLADADSNRNSHLTPPPQKRIKSADLFRAQHGISPERLLLDREFPVAGQHPLTRERRDRSRDVSRDRSLDLRESLLGQALESSNGPQNQKTHPDLASLHAQSAGEDSNSSDTEPSDRGDGQHDGTMDSINGSMDNQRSHSFPNAFLGIPGLLAGPSGISANDFVSRRSLEMRVRATDPRPCPKCGKIYRSAHTLRTHLEDKHTVCPGYRCVLCGTVAKSRNSLHSHMSRQHRGISTKDLPVLPMPSAFDPELASRLLAKAGVKISPAELRARASPTSSSGGGGSGGNGAGGQSKVDLANTGGATNDEAEDSDDDPEDLTTGSGGYGVGSVGGSNSSSNELSRYHESLLNFGHANTTISRIRSEAAAAAAAAALGQQKDMTGGQIPTSTAAGQSLLDLQLLQFITESTFGMGMSQEHAAAAALHAAKMAQLNAMGQGLDKLPPGLLQPQFDLSKIAGAGGAFGSGNNGGLTIEPIMRREQPNSGSPNENGPTALTSTSIASCSSDNGATGAAAASSGTLDARHHSVEPMDLGVDNNQSGSNNDGANSDLEENYSEDEGAQKT